MGGIFFFVEFFLSHSAEKFRGGTTQCFKKIGVSKKFMHKKGKSLFSVESFWSHSAEKILSFKKFPYRKFSCIGGGHHGFIENFLFHMTEKFR